MNGRATAVRGTSFAAPLVAATLARAYPAPAQIGAPGPGDGGSQRATVGTRYGRGLASDGAALRHVDPRRD